MSALHVTGERDVPDPVRAGDAVLQSRLRALRRVVAAFLVLWIVGYAGGVVLSELLLSVGAPFGAVPLPYLVGMAVPGAVLAWCVSSARCWKAYGLAVAVALAAWLVPWHPRSSFVKDLDGVRVGMTVEEVESRMGGWGFGYDDAYTTVPADWPAGEARATFTGRLGFRWTPGPTADWGHVRFRGGRVVGVYWSPD